MITTNRTSAKKKQDGLALLVLVITLALIISSYYFSTISLPEIRADNIKQTRVALKQAKQLLLGYSVIRSDLSDAPTPSFVSSEQFGRYGFLPCPADNNDEGTSVGNCDGKNKNTLGWFPWRSLKTLPLKDGNGDCLLYAVSGAYKASPSTDMLNEDSNGMFQVVSGSGSVIQGNDAADRVVAIVFSPGGVLNGQNRNYADNSECGDDTANFSAYLDSFEVSAGVFIDNAAVVTGNADEVYQFVRAASATNKITFNDQFITITREELWAAVQTRNDFDSKMRNLTEALAVCLSQYAAANANSRLPWPAPIDLDNYRAIDEYSDYDNSAEAIGYAGRMPFFVDDSNARIGGISSAELFTAAGCDSLVLPDGGITADLLASTDEEYKNLWDNWKDHFFYAVAKSYAPQAIAAVPCLPMGACISVNGTKRAAVVIYAGPRVSAKNQTRNDPLAADIESKNLIVNYIENGNELVFPDLPGTGSYVTSGNDIMFCINDGLGVVPC